MELQRSNDSQNGLEEHGGGNNQTVLTDYKVNEEAVGYGAGTEK